MASIDEEVKHLMWSEVREAVSDPGFANIEHEARRVDKPNTGDDATAGLIYPNRSQPSEQNELEPEVALRTAANAEWCFKKPALDVKRIAATSAVAAQLVMPWLAPTAQPALEAPQDKLRGHDQGDRQKVHPIPEEFRGSVSFGPHLQIKVVQPIAEQSAPPGGDAEGEPWQNKGGRHT
eukprot:CAMPEP_0115132578 /NCGR_PEP_ID=MMETSP0227-20121206/53840_1 /TAXON_ID=89957 /ORGANISM="Polarella glacialis, Strain CCMP 1383" /LENGTH=178 /DNA_ID=CAMNT_0002538405 /DNA_START=195 /DNA_END=731 /DNA_ORIENTATION=-